MYKIDKQGIPCWSSSYDSAISLLRVQSLVGELKSTQHDQKNENRNKQIRIEDVLRSTGRYSHYLVITLMEHT